MDWRIIKFLTEYQYNLSERDMPVEKKIEIIKDAINNNKKIEIVYLKKSDEKTRRVIQPIEIGEMVYMDKSFLGLRAYCMKRDDERVFRVDRILEIKVL